MKIDILLNNSDISNIEVNNNLIYFIKLILHSKNKLSLLYIYNLNSKLLKCIILDHTLVVSTANIETILLYIFKVISNNIILTNKRLFIKFLYAYNKDIVYNTNIKDVDLYTYINFRKIISIKNKTILYFKNTFDTVENLNTIIPIYKHLLYCLNYRKLLQSNLIIQLLQNLLFLFYSDRVLPLFFLILKNGIYFDNSLIYSLYLFNTIHGRPSAKHILLLKRFNILTLPKLETIRNLFTSRYKNGILVLIDYHAFHLHIISKIIEYLFPPNNNLYLYFSNLLFGKTNKNSILETKALMFKMMYGYYDLSTYGKKKFFTKLKNFTDNYWQLYISNNSSILPIINRSIPDIKKKLTLINYLIVNWELKHNIPRLHRVNKLLLNLNTKLVLYKFDSFLFDVHPELIHVIKEIKAILELLNFKTHINVGKNYYKMSKVKEK